MRNDADAAPAATNRDAVPSHARKTVSLLSKQRWTIKLTKLNLKNTAARADGQCVCHVAWQWPDSLRAHDVDEAVHVWIALCQHEEEQVCLRRRDVFDAGEVRNTRRDRLCQGVVVLISKMQADQIDLVPYMCLENVCLCLLERFDFVNSVRTARRSMLWSRA